MPEYGNDRDESETSKKRQQNVIDNPHITAWFFNRRIENFLSEVLIPVWISKTTDTDMNGNTKEVFMFIK
jgi:hypothetical protein